LQVGTQSGAEESAENSADMAMDLVSTANPIESALDPASAHRPGYDLGSARDSVPDSLTYPEVPTRSTQVDTQPHHVAPEPVPALDSSPPGSCALAGSVAQDSDAFQEESPSRDAVLDVSAPSVVHRPRTRL
jgi:hypothetical protein